MEPIFPGNAILLKELGYFLIVLGYCLTNFIFLIEIGDKS